MLCFRAIGREFPWTMVVADVTQPILGIDFLSKNKVTINCANNTLFDPLTTRTVQLQHSDLYNKSVLGTLIIYFKWVEIYVKIVFIIICFAAQSHTVC